MLNKPFNQWQAISQMKIELLLMWGDMRDKDPANGRAAFK